METIKKNSLYIHIGAELLIIGGVAFYLHKENQKLLSLIGGLNQRLADHESVLQQLIANQQRSPQQKKRSVKFQEPVIQQRPRKEPVKDPIIDPEPDLDQELASELSELSLKIEEVKPRIREILSDEEVSDIEDE